MIRDDVWAPLFHAPGAEGASRSERLRRIRLECLGFNPAATDDVLVRLLDVTNHLLWRALPTAVVEAAIAHPDRRVRGGLAEYQPGMTSGQWTRLVLGEEGAARRAAVLQCAVVRLAELTPDGYERVAADTSPFVRETAAELQGLPAPLLVTLATDAHPRVRAAACPRAWPHLAASVREGLLADPEAQVRTAALLRHHEDHPMPGDVFDALEDDRRALAACCLEGDLAARLVAHPDRSVRLALAGNPHLRPDLVGLLAGDIENDVRVAVSVRPELTESQRASVRAELETDRMFRELPWIVALHGDPEAMRCHARSAHVFLRRSVARAPRLPADVVDVLARDEDRVVRLFLAESCQDAPADLLLEVWGWWTGSFSHPDRPRGHPNFPREGLLRYADDPNPRMRRLTLGDPNSTADLVDRFSRDPSAEVRCEAAADPRLTAAAAVRLLEDESSSVRHFAARHPGLPEREIVRLLYDPETAEAAVRNPSIPVVVMHRMIDEARER